jgi:hypothetical protein
MDGFSLCFGDLSLRIDRVGALKAGAVELFGYSDLILVTGYLSPPKAIGVLHFDRQHNFFIQREGTKRWYLSKIPAVKNPYDNVVYPGVTQSYLDDMAQRGYRIRLPRDCGQVEYVLSPGDVLYVPPGFYHSAETLGETSFHYTLTLEPACFWRDFNGDIFSKMLSSGGKLFDDYRFLSPKEKERLFADCFDYVVGKVK